MLASFGALGGREPIDTLWHEAGVTRQPDGVLQVAVRMFVQSRKYSGPTPTGVMLSLREYEALVALAPQIRETITQWQAGERSSS